MYAGACIPALREGFRGFMAQSPIERLPLVSALLSWAALSTVPTLAETPPEIRVQGSRPEAPATLDPIELFDTDFIVRTDAFTADEVLAQVTADLPGAQQVVLIDGRETQVDISTIPAEMIERIEVSTTGVMPDGRPRVVGNVINVILKQDYNGATFGGRARDSFAGGGGLNQLNASGGRKLGKFSARINLNHRDQDALLASDRAFSREQDHTVEGGSDYRAPYGTVAVAKAVAGTLNGVTDMNGAPTAIALAPDVLPGHALTPSDFLAAPAGTLNAAGLRHFNTAEYLYLAAPSTNNAMNSDVAFEMTPSTKLAAGYSFSRTRSRQLTPPPITRVSAASLVPAAHNPFGQDVEVGLVHQGFGPVQRETSADRQSGYFSGDGSFGATWKWNGRFDVNHRTSNSETDNLDPARFAASLASTDPAERFDPFADTSAGSANAALYPGLTTERLSAGTSDDRKLRLDSRGQVSAGWIAPLILHLGVERSTNSSRQSVDSGSASVPDVSTISHLASLRATANLDIPAFKVRELELPAILTLSSYATRDEQRVTQSVAMASPTSRLDFSTLTLNGFLNVPWFTPADAHAGIRELQTQLGIGTARVDGESHFTHSAGVVWSPARPLTFRADHSRQIAPTPVLLYPLSVDYNQTLIDRRRSNPLSDNVEVVSNQPNAQTPPLATRLQLSAQWTPPAFEKLRLTLTYSAIEQEGQQRTFSAQDILDNEAALAARVTRLPPTADDIALGQPGEIAQVDITPFSGGRRKDRSLGFQAQFAEAIADFGKVNVRAHAEHLLTSTNELFGGTQVVSTSDQEVPPTWKISGHADWQRGNWNAAMDYNYASGGRYAGVPYASFGTLDARFGYLIDTRFGGRFGTRLRLGAGIQNLFDRDPPFANTLSGFRGGSPLGRSFELTLRVPLGT